MTTAAPEIPRHRTVRWRCTCMGWEAVCELAAGALTYRQLHYWTQGGVVPSLRHRNHGGEHVTGPEHGSGTAYGWQPADAARIATMAHLVKATGMRPESAWILARDGGLVVDGGPEAWLSLKVRRVAKHQAAETPVQDTK